MIHQLWEQFLALSVQELGARIVDTWFRALRLTHWDSRMRVVHLMAPNQFVRDWVSSHYKKHCTVHLQRLFNCHDITVIIITPDQPAVPKATSRAFVARSENRELDTVHQALFDSFVVDESNSLAYTAAMNVSAAPGGVYNPLVLWGGPGVGKTHLLQAIAQNILIARPTARIVYQSADKFTAEFIAAVRSGSVQKIYSKYAQVDTLLFDDIQLIAHKERTQEAFSQIFNGLYEQRKQIIITSDCPPHDIPGLSSRVSSRLSSGLVADIKQPTHDARVRLLTQRITRDNRQNNYLGADIISAIALSVHGGMRELEGAYIRVCAYATVSGIPVTAALVRQVLGEGRLPAENNHNNSIDLMCIARVVSAHFECDVAALRSRSRLKQVALARHVAMYLMKKITQRTLRDIGLFWGRVDHTTVMHALERVTDLRTQDEQFNMMVSKLERTVLHGVSA